MQFELDDFPNRRFEYLETFADSSPKYGSRQQAIGDCATVGQRSRFETGKLWFFDFLFNLTIFFFVG